MGGWLSLFMQTCRHFRNQVPQEYADELREADPEPCPLCDALPHRQNFYHETVQPVEIRSAVKISSPRPTVEAGWATGLLAFLRRQRI